MEKLAELRVNLRDLLTATGVRQFTTAEWLEQHDARLSAALEEWMKTLGGTIKITGTPERGRVTVYRKVTDTAPMIDFEWVTETVAD